MPDERSAMPSPQDVDPLFDGHLERPLAELTVSERLDWIWEAMQLLRDGMAANRAVEACDVGPRLL